MFAIWRFADIGVLTNDRFAPNSGRPICANSANWGLAWIGLVTTVVILNAGRRGQSGGELDAACVVYCAHVGDVAVRTDKH